MEYLQTVFVVDDDRTIRHSLCRLLTNLGYRHRAYPCAPDFLADYDPTIGGCLILDIRMPRMSGLELQGRLRDEGCRIPIIFITGHGSIHMAVEAMRRGALDFMSKPLREDELLNRINEALQIDAGNRRLLRHHRLIADRMAKLTRRERQVFDGVTDGKMNKVIAHELGLSLRTVEVYRAGVMRKIGAQSLAQLVRVRVDHDRTPFRPASLSGRARPVAVQPWRRIDGATSTRNRARLVNRRNAPKPAGA